MSIDQDSANDGGAAERFSIDVHIEFWDKKERFAVKVIREAGELRYLVSHEQYGEEELSMNMELGRLHFRSQTGEHWHLMEENIASVIEARSM